MSLTFALACRLLALLCFAIAAIVSRAWYGPTAQWGWAGTGFIAAGLFFAELANTFG